METRGEAEHRLFQERMRLQELAEIYEEFVALSDHLFARDYSRYIQGAPQKLTVSTLEYALACVRDRRAYWDKHTLVGEQSAE